jgi:zinc/manganese transport system permease protein
LLSILFLLLLAITIAIAIQVVGALLVFALLIAPAASAMRFTHCPLTSITLSVIFGLAITWTGLLLTVVGTGRYLPASFYIATLATLLYVASALAHHWQINKRGYKEISFRAQ